MADRLSVQKSAARALALYLQAELDSDLGPREVSVEEQWPAPSEELPPMAVTVLLAGKRDDSFCLDGDQNVCRVEDVPGEPQNGIFTYRVRACRQPLQLDVWAHYDATRDLLLDALERALNQGATHTLGIPNLGMTRDGPLLALDPQFGYHGFADFCFDGPENTHQSDSVRQNEFRSRITGFVDVDLTVKAKTTRLALVQLQTDLGTIQFEATG